MDFIGTVTAVREKDGQYGKYLGITVEASDTKLWFRRGIGSALYDEAGFLGFGTSENFFTEGSPIRLSGEENGTGDGIIFLKDVAVVGLEEQEAQRRPDKKPVATIGTLPEDAPKGTFTVVFEDGERRTIRISPVNENDPQFGGWTFFKYLYGPENDTAYRGFAYTKSGETDIITKRGFTDDSYIVRALNSILEADTAKRHEMGVIWASESGNCYVCGRTLTVPESIEAGIGPDCAGRLGL